MEIAVTDTYCGVQSRLSVAEAGRAALQTSVCERMRGNGFFRSNCPRLVRDKRTQCKITNRPMWLQVGHAVQLRQPRRALKLEAEQNGPSRTVKRQKSPAAGSPPQFGSLSVTRRHRNIGHSDVAQIWTRDWDASSAACADV